MTLLGRAVASLVGQKDSYTAARDVVLNWADPTDLTSFLGGYRRAYANLYEQQLWVYTVVNKLARGIGRLPLKVYRERQGKRERVDKSDPLYRLLIAPAPRMNPTHWKQAIVTDAAIFGNCMVIKVAKNDRVIPSALIPVSPIGWEQLPDGRWKWSNPTTGETKPFEPWQVAHFHHYSPGRRSDWAVSPLEPLRLTLAIEYAAQRYGVASFENGARPGGILTTEKQLTKENRAALRDDIMKLHGGSRNAGKLAVLDNGLEWQKMTWDANESAVIDHRRLSREEVCAAYDVPPPMVGILDRATFSNIETQARMLYSDTLGPWLVMAEETIEAQIIASVPALAGYSVEFDLNEVLKGDVQTRFAAYAQLVNAGVATQEEIRGWENLPETDDPDAHILHRPANLTPLAARPVAPAPAPPPGNGG